MKTCKTPQEFINYLVPFAKKVCKRYGYKVSILIAQAIQECGAGIPEWFDNKGIYDLLKYNNLIGQKSELMNDTWKGYSVWPGKSFYKDTPEEEHGKKITIKDGFRIFDTEEQSFADFVLFLLYADGGKRYGKSVVNTSDPHELIVKVGKKYATDSKYAESVWSIVTRYNLTQYDNLDGVEMTAYIPPAMKGENMGVKKLNPREIIDITKENLSQVPRRRTEKIKFIVVHYLGVPNKDNPYLYGGGYGGHYNIQRDGKVFLAANPKTAVVWHCGGGLQGSGGHEFYKICTNDNSIGIENGVCYTKNVKEGDGDSNFWYFTEETQESLVWLVSRLMDEYNVPIERVIRHYSVTGKLCPNPYVKNNKLKSSWTWSEFINNVKQYRNNGTITVPNRIKPTPDPEPKNYLEKGDRGEAVKTMQALLIKAGYSCGSAGADGVFGNGTLQALKSFQKDHGLKVDGKYGSTSKATLEAIANKKTAKDITVSQFCTSCKNVMDTARTNEWKYGDSHTLPPCNDKTISCDRLIARALWDLGFTDQKQGGETCGTLDSYLATHGFIRSTSPADIKKGSILLVKHGGQSYIGHAFVCTKFNNWVTNRYDAGSNERIQTVQPLKNVEWAYTKEIVVYNIPAKSNWKATGTATATVDDLNVRKGPGTEYDIIRTLGKGNRFEVDGNTDGNWVHCKVQNDIGWVSKKYIKYD